MDLRLPGRAGDAHKGDCGRVLVVAGSVGMTGAAVLCASAALRAGAGLVTVATPEPCWPVVAAGQPCAMTLPLASHQGRLAAACLPQLLDAAGRADVTVCGPGLGTGGDIPEIVGQLLRLLVGRLVLDADGLNAVASPEQLAGHAGERVLTPHPGEFARLVGAGTRDVQVDREGKTRDFVTRFGGVLVLKGAGTLVADGRRCERNATGNPGMATAGSGDVLAGVIGGLWAQGMDAWGAARLGVHLHGRAGDLAAARLGVWSLTASDLLNYLPAAFVEFAGSTEPEVHDARPMPALPKDGVTG
jgi:NAD(P)H-hydrate epimerase